MLQLLWQYVVEEMNILTTVFLGDFNAKVWYPNSVLATKPITNYYRSPEMGDVFEFFIDATTTADKIGRLKEAIGRWVFFHSQYDQSFQLHLLFVTAKYAPISTCV